VSRQEIVRPAELREAIVYVRFMVSEAGIPTEVAVQEDRGFHTEPFRQAALNGVRGMRFRPALRNGVPVVSGPLFQPITFGLGHSGEEQAVTPEFSRELGRVEKLLKEGDYAGAHLHARWMLREKVTLRHEFGILHAQLAQTLATAGRYDEALAAAQSATIHTSLEAVGFRVGEPPPPNDASKYLLPKELIVHLLDLRMRLLAQRGDVLGALKTYNELAGLETLKLGDARTALSEKLIALLQSGKALLYNGEVKVNQEPWSHELYHPRFTTKNVQGRLDHIELRCRGQNAEYTYEADTLWTVPPGWERCVVKFHGETGTKLELIELPAD
jgi:hypothetical protein